MIFKKINALRWKVNLVVAASIGFSVTHAHAQELIIPGNAERLSVTTSALCSVSTDNVLNCFVSNFRSVQLIPPDDIGLVKDVSVGDGHACAITIDDSVVCWGDSNFDRLAVPANASPATHIAVSETHSCSINTRGEAICWGSNDNGRSTPPNNGASYTDISIGLRNSCAVRTDGVVDCWGAEDVGANIRPDNFPLASKVDLGASASCILSVDGDIVCWSRESRTENTVRLLEVPENGPYTDLTLAGGGGAGTMVCGLQPGGNADCVVTSDTESSTASNAITADKAFELEQRAAALGPYSSIDARSVLSRVGGDPRAFFAACGIQLDGFIVCWEAPDRIDPSISGNLGAQLFVPQLSAEIYSDNLIELFWDVPAPFNNNTEFNLQRTVVMYEIFRDGELLATTANNGSYIDTTLAPATTYSYEIRVITEQGAVADFSEALSVNTSERQAQDPNAYQIPDRPLSAQNLQPLVYGPSTVELIWDNPNSADISFEIYLNGEFIDHTTGSSFFFDNLPSNTVYYFQVVTVLGDGQIAGITNVPVGLGEGGVCF